MSKSREAYWTAFYTKPRNEKKAAERLEENGFSIYCPTRTVVRQWSDRKKKVTEPVFKSYLFAKVNQASLNEILKDNGIVSNVRWLGKPVVIRESEIQELKAFLEDFPTAEVNYGQYVPGDKIYVKFGPLAGQSGEIRRIKGKRAYLVLVSLGIEVSAEISLARLQKVD